MSPFELAARDVPKGLRAHQGSEQITAWCPTCQENAIPMRNGTCAFCDTPIAGPALNGNGHAPRSQIEAPAEAEGGVLRLGDELLLPLAAATESLAILAVKGAGKSNAAAVLAEEMFDEGIPWIVIDPKGDWWGIRESIEGSRGLPVLVLGGLHGDLPLSPSSGATIAELIVQRNLTCVLDISAMDDEERPEFLEALGDHLFELHRQTPNVRHVILEEAHEIVPQSGGKAMRGTLKAWTRIVCQGRQRGLGITLVSQRSALVHKNVLTQTGSLLVLRTTSPQDRAVIRSWTDFHSVSRELVDSLPGLANGEAWIVAPSWLQRVDRVRLRRRWTFDSGSTPPVIATRQAQQSIDIDEIGRILAGEHDVAAEHGDDLAHDRVGILGALADGPRRMRELVDATGINRATLLNRLRKLAGQGAVRMEGRYASAVWMLIDEASPAEPGELSTPADLTASDRLAAPARQLIEGEQRVADALEQLDEILDEPREGLTLLRGRYLAALLARIESGCTDPSLLDRFERVAGFSSGEPNTGRPCAAPPLTQPETQPSERPLEDAILDAAGVDSL